MLHLPRPAVEKKIIDIRLNLKGTSAKMKRLIFILVGHRLES